MPVAEPYQPLVGVRVLAWEQAVALPMATRLLADLGATVIRLESHTRGGKRPRYLGNDLARNKLGLAVDLRQEAGRTLVRRLADRVDVLCENFTPRVKRQFGLTYEALSAEHPALIMLSLSGYGQSGAWAARPTYGPGIEAAAGQAQSMGYPDAPPTRPGTIVYGDNISGFYAALAVTGALLRRRLTGRGSYIDLAMYEANAFHLGLSLARSSLSGAPEPRRGNADPDAAVQGVYESREPERWLAVTVRHERVAALAALLRADQNCADLDRVLASWVAERSVQAAAQLLQAAGIAAAPVLNARDLLQNAQLRRREAFTLVQHATPVDGYTAHPHAASPFRFDRRPRPTLREAPAVGQETRAILADWLELADDEIEGLFAAGVVGETATPAVIAPAHTPPDRASRRLAWRLIADYDPEPGKTLGLPRQ